MNQKTCRFVPMCLATVAVMVYGITSPIAVTHAAEARLAAQSRRARLGKQQPVTFNMIVSAGAAACVPNASASVTITPSGPVEIMDVSVSGLPPNDEFDFFVIQLPTAPFGVAWYQGDIETDDNGEGFGEFIGRFSIETFAVAQGTGPAPVIFDQPPFPDADSNPPFEPIHTYHLGLWFGSPDEAVAVGCPDTVTRFNGPHNAGIQVLNTANFDDLAGPLLQVQ